MGKDPVIRARPRSGTWASSARRWTGFFLLAAAPALASGPDTLRLRSVVFDGAHEFSDSRLLDLSGWHRGMPFDSSALTGGLDAMVAAYQLEGFAAAAIDSVRLQPEAGNMDVTVFVHEGSPLVVRSIRFSGDTVLSAGELRATMELREGERFLPATLRADLRSILDLYARRGYALANAEVSDFRTVDSGGVVLTDIGIGITEGGRVTIRDIRVEGNTKTRADVIVRESRIHAGDVFDAELPDRVRRRLNHLGLFASVDEPRLTLDDRERAGVLIRVTEGSYNSFDGIVGYSPAPRPGASGSVVGLVDLQFRNLFGTARRLGARWYRESEQTQEVSLQYREPWVFSLPLNAQVGFFQRKQDSTFVQFRYDVGMDAVVSDELSLGATYTRTDVYPTEGYGRSVMHDASTSAIGASVRYDTRDDVLSPSSGVLYTTEYQTGQKSATVQTSIRRVSVDISVYVRVAAHQVLAAEMHGRDVESSQLDASDLFRLGGARTLRGYREAQFTSPRIAWANFEYRFLTGPRSYFYGFLDLGLIGRAPGLPSGAGTPDLTRAGYGAGVRLDSAVGLIGVNIGFGQGDTFSTAKLHLQLINEF